MKQTMLGKRLLALVLALAMLASLAACGKAPEETLQTPAPGSQEFTREEKELIAQLVGGETETEDLSDPELDQLVQELTGSLMEQEAASVIQLGNSETDSTDGFSQEPGAYDQNGAMTAPFDQVYPELIEKGEIAFSDESLLLKLASDTLTDGMKAAGVAALEQVVPMDGCGWYEAKLAQGTDAQQALAALRELKEVLLAEYNYQIRTAALDAYKDFSDKHKDKFDKNDKHTDQWHMHHCGIPDGFDQLALPGGDPSVVVAVIDTGVDYDHEDLAENIWVNTDEIPDNGIDDDDNGYVDDYYGVDLVRGSGSGDDDNGHGTHVAGVIAAQNNNLGVVGIAYNVKIMPIKAAMHSGVLNQSDIARAVLYAYENGAEVINMSFGGAACSIAVQDALATAYTRCVLVASAGNNAMHNEGPLSLPNYPAGLTYVLGVMSVDERGVESVFTNYDVAAFSPVEYELYAPGENIMSTLPGNSYGMLSGTSMAAPMVSAMAAVLRSEYTDRDSYPTKFIYGQLASTSENYATCAGDHSTHNLPQIVNLYDALTKLPVPEVQLQEYALFDDPALSSGNNGDGVIDAGETIALGLTLRNRWGMSKDTLVTLDTLSQAGIADPYITIDNPTVDYGSVGTYSTQDAGRIYTDELLTGWEKPFILHISPDCPNDYVFSLNVTIRCENALNPKDTATYTFSGEVTEFVRSGYILPSVIDRDMVLTPENLYIIPNSTVIEKGVTVRVEPGTHIQFWGDDPDDPYADSYIAGLKVKGKFLVEGTKEQPVYIYPSDLMYNYVVDISVDSTSGYIGMKYADVTNLTYSSGFYTNYAENCTFRISTVDLWRRVLDDGRVYGTTDVALPHVQNAKDCIFYKIAASSYYNLHGAYDRCIFVDCGINFSDGTYTDCVFLGNRFSQATQWGETGRNSSMNLSSVSLLTQRSFRIHYRPETGTTYIRTDNSYFHSPGLFAKYLQAAFGGGLAKTETPEEAEWIDINIGDFQALITWSNALDAFIWGDGTPLPQFLLPLQEADSGSSLVISKGKLTEGYSYTGYLFEIPGKILPEAITFADYCVDMDLQSTYQTAPLNTPVQLPLDCFLYESSDPAVLTVSDTGLVTPVGLGTADVWVYSLDKAVKNHITVTVKELVPLEALSFPAEYALLAKEQTLPTGCVLTPANTTRHNVVYTSSDEAVATVDTAGNVLGIAPGTATITAQCEGFTDSMQVEVYQQATSLQLSNAAITVALSDGNVALPEVLTNQGAQTELSWRSSDTAVADIENGKLVLKKTGTTTIEVTDTRSGLSTACIVIVQDTIPPAIRNVVINGATHAVLLEDGSLYAWSRGCRSARKIATEVVCVDATSYQLLLAKKDGTVEKWYCSGSSIYKDETFSFFQGKQIADVALGNSDNGSYAVLTKDGSAYSWGYNGNGQLGLGNTQNASTPILIDLDGIVQVRTSRDGNYFAFLTESGELYASGYINGDTNTVPTLVSTNVVKITECEYGNIFFLANDGQLKQGSFDYISPIWGGLGEFDCVSWTDDGTYPGCGIKDGKVYPITRNGIANALTGIADALAVYSYNGAHYITTESGMLLFFGSNEDYNHTMEVTAETLVRTPVAVPLLPIAEETVVLLNHDLEDGVLTDGILELSFNKALASVTPVLYADGTQITIRSQITHMNRLELFRTTGFTEGVQYELVLPAGTVTGAMGTTNDQEIRLSFTYREAASGTEIQPGQDAPVVHPSQLDTSVARILTSESLIQKLGEFRDATQYNPRFSGNVILNPISTDTNVEHWLRFLAPSTEGKHTPLGGNYWGTTNETGIGLQLIDYSDFTTYGRIMYAPYLTEAPENTFPFVTSVTLWNKEGKQVTTVGNEEITFRVTFNRDMDTSIALQVRFGSSAPYAEYEIPGAYVDSRTWEGTYKLQTIIENGYQYFSISEGCAADADLPLQPDQFRFLFEIDTTAAQALIMQGSATAEGISLKWTQDDFDTLMGYNIYRSEDLNGEYQRINSTVIPAETMTFFDDTVEPGKVYYYNFTVVKTDLTESIPSGKITIMSRDTMAPNIYHSPVHNATLGENLVITATVTDNLTISYANLYYRTAGSSDWKMIRMNMLNDKYSAIIPAANLSAEGLEYYIDAFDGVSHTYRGSSTDPFCVTVQEAISKDSLGDVDGDGSITNRDALILLQAISHKYNMTSQEFKRADLNADGKLSAVEALRLLDYVSGKIGSVSM